MHVETQAETLPAAAVPQKARKKRPPKEIRPDTSTLLPLEEYDRVILETSGGKDSLGCILLLLELGVPKDKIELWHHCVDGAPGSERLFDWPCTESYVRALAEALGLRIRFQWKEGGLKGEMLRSNARTAPNSFELLDGSVKTVGGTRGKVATRLRFPEIAASLSARWCSSYGKLDPSRTAVCNDPSLLGKKILEVTGERREESGNRATYATVERHHATNSRRRVDIWRPILEWSEAEVWAIIERWRIRPHPCYSLGFGRASCMTCVFGLAPQWHTVRLLDPEIFQAIADYEIRFGRTINRKLSVVQLADRGHSTLGDATPEEIRLAMVPGAFTAGHVFLPPGESWRLPRGAFQRCGGPS